MIVADANGIICRMNARAAETFGYTREQLHGMSVDNLMPERYRKGHGSHLLRYFADPQPRGMNQGIELFGERADGSEFPIELGLSPFHEPDGKMAVAAVRDITLRKEQEEEIKLREARFRTLVDNIPGTVYRCLHDAEWTMQFISDDVEALSGYPASELIDNEVRTFDSIINPSDRESVAEKVGEAVEAKLPWLIEYRIDRRDGETRWVGETGRAIYREGGEVDYLDGVIADISKRKEMEAQLLVAREQAEAANRAKSEFLSHMSHELRTPLNGVLGYAQILQRSPDVTEKQRGSLDAIISCGDHLLSLINDVLDLSKIEAGRIELDMAPCDLHQLIEGVANILRPRAQEGGVGFKIEVGPEVPMGVVSDAAKLRQILVNLLGNAVKFTSQGDVILRIGELPDGTFRFEVIDSGVGIAADELEAIFDPFKQVEAGKAAGGTGLGLAITQRLVAKLGGTLVVESELGKGSNFKFAIPLEEVETADFEAIGEDAFDASSAKLAPGQDITILVADDRETNRDILEQMLDDMGFTTVLADDGDVAIDVLRTRHFDMVLMDVRMPRMNGIDAVKIIRGDDSIKDVKVIAVTASVFPDFKNKAIIAGFDDFLGKPFRASELIGKLQQHLGIEFVYNARESKMESDGGGGAAETIVLPEDASEDLRKALKIRNLTAINAIAARLSADAATAAAGEEIGRLARAFDFSSLGELADKT
jgi:PAS domain S-box-containing protein